MRFYTGFLSSCISSNSPNTRVRLLHHISTISSYIFGVFTKKGFLCEGQNLYLFVGETQKILSKTHLII